MYGVIFDFLRQYVVEKHGGKETWGALLKANGYNYKIYFPVEEYPDEEMVKLVSTASKALDLPIPVVLEDFGTYVGPKLTSFYGVYIKDESWKTFDVVEAAGNSIHDSIHSGNPKRQPPELSAARESDDLLVVKYRSHRKLCHVVRGILKGLGDQYGEQFEIDETQCMHDGADKCVMRVNRVF